MSTYQVLPDELLLHIFSFVDWRDLIRLSEVDERTHQLANDCLLWKDHFGHLRDERLVQDVGEDVRAFFIRSECTRRCLNEGQLSIYRRFSLPANVQPDAVDACTVVTQQGILRASLDPVEDVVYIQDLSGTTPAQAFSVPDVVGCASLLIDDQPIVAVATRTDAFLWTFGLDDTREEIALVACPNNPFHRFERSGTSLAIVLVQDCVLVLRDERPIYVTPTTVREGANNTERTRLHLIGDEVWALSDGSMRDELTLSRLNLAATNEADLFDEERSVDFHGYIHNPVAAIDPQRKVFAALGLYGISILSYEDDPAELARHWTFKQTMQFCYMTSHPARFQIGSDRYVVYGDSGLVSDITADLIRVSCFTIWKNPPLAPDDPTGEVTQIQRNEDLGRAEAPLCFRLFENLGSLYLLVVDEQRVSWYAVESQALIGEHRLELTEGSAPVSLSPVGPPGTAQFVLCVQQAGGAMEALLLDFATESEERAPPVHADKPKSSQDLLLVAGVVSALALTFFLWRLRRQLQYTMAMTSP